jgi:hypothetical protein
VRAKTSLQINEKITKGDPMDKYTENAVEETIKELNESMRGLSDLICQYGDISLPYDADVYDLLSEHLKLHLKFLENVLSNTDIDEILSVLEEMKENLDEMENTLTDSLEDSFAEDG